MDLPNDTAISPSSRLKLCDTIFEEAKSTALPQLAYIYSKLMGSHLAVVSSWLLRNTIIPMGLSNFPGSASEIFYNGKKGLAGDFAAGAVSGVAGMDNICILPEIFVLVLLQYFIYFRVS